MACVFPLRLGACLKQGLCISSLGWRSSFGAGLCFSLELWFHDSRVVSTSSPLIPAFEMPPSSSLSRPCSPAVSPQVSLPRTCTLKSSTLKGRLCLCSAPTRAAKTTWRARYGAKSGGSGVSLDSPGAGYRGRVTSCRTIPRPRWSRSPWRPSGARTPAGTGACATAQEPCTP